MPVMDSGISAAGHDSLPDDQTSDLCRPPSCLPDTDIVPSGPRQPPRRLTTRHVEQIADRILRFGLLQPLVVVLRPALYTATDAWPRLGWPEAERIRWSARQAR